MMIATALQNVQEADKVTIDVGVRVGERVTHPSLCREMNNSLWFFPGEHFFHAVTISKIQVVKAKLLMVGKYGQPIFLEAYVIIIIDAIESDDCIAACEKTLRDVKSDKAGDTGN
jgi:hypothetical protein